MLYKTIVLRLLEDRPQTYERLRRERALRPALARYSMELKARHEQWKDRLAQAQPGSDPSQIASAALELALRELEALLPNESSTNDLGVFSLDEAMAFLCRHSPLE